MDDILVAISLLVAWVAFMAMNLAAANRERDKLEMRLKRIEGKHDTR